MTVLDPFWGNSGWEGPSPAGPQGICSLKITYPGGSPHEAPCCVGSIPFGCGNADRIGPEQSQPPTGARSANPDPELQHLPPAAKPRFSDLWSAAQQNIGQWR